MKTWTWKAVSCVTGLSAAIIAASPARAQNAEATYKSKCAACHAADGSGSEVGKKLGTHDFGAPDIQKMSDAEWTDAIAKGKNKMPGYEKTLKPDEIKGLVTYIRALKK